MYKYTAIQLKKIFIFIVKIVLTMVIAYGSMFISKGDNMKITQADIEKIKPYFVKALDYISRDRLIKYIGDLLEDPTVKDCKVRYSWDIFHGACKMYTKETGLYWHDAIYASGCYDSHIQTAIYSILKSLNSDWDSVKVQRAETKALYNILEPVYGDKA